MIPTHEFQPQQAFMMCLPQAMRTQQQTNATIFENVPGYRLGMEAKTTTAGIPIHKMPKLRLMEGIEFAEPQLDATLIAGLAQPLLGMILWEVTRLNPNTKITELRCSTYLELYQRFRCAAARHKNASEQTAKRYIEGFLSATSLPEFIIEHAMDAGFDPSWLEPEKKRQ